MRGERFSVVTGTDSTRGVVEAGVRFGLILGLCMGVAAILTTVRVMILIVIDSIFHLVR